MSVEGSEARVWATIGVSFELLLDSSVKDLEVDSRCFELGGCPGRRQEQVSALSCSTFDTYSCTCPRGSHIFSCGVSSRILKSILELCGLVCTLNASVAGNRDTQMWRNCTTTSLKRLLIHFDILEEELVSEVFFWSVDHVHDHTPLPVSLRRY